MTMSWLLAAIHLLGVCIAFVAIWCRARALGRVHGYADLAPVFAADSVWGLSALLLVLTGLTRAFGGFEKGTEYYGHQPFFHIKMGCLVVVLLLEIYPMITLLRWRIARKDTRPSNLAVVGRLAQISYVQNGLLVVMVLAATAMARGIEL